MLPAKFVAVDLPFAYNAIIDLLLNRLKVVVSMYHMAIKFLT